MACSVDEQCRVDQSCVEGRCWELQGGVPSNCVGFVSGGSGSACQSVSALFTDADLTCSDAGGQLDEQVPADACGAEQFRTALNLCCTKQNADPNVVSGTNVTKLRERLKKKALDDAFGCAASADNQGTPALPVALLAALLGVFVLRRSRA